MRGSRTHPVVKTLYKNVLKKDKMQLKVAYSQWYQIA